jgi:hypothetical protein
MLPGLVNSSDREGESEPQPKLEKSPRKWGQHRYPGETHSLQEMKPTGPLQITLAEAMAAELIRIKRANEMEADDIDASIEFPPAPTFYPGIMRGRLAASDAERLIRLHQRNRTASLNAFLRISHDIERRQRMRSGKVIQAPNVLDVNVKGTK